MILTIFRSRLKPGQDESYMEWASRLGVIAMQMPGYINHKGFFSADGERVTIVEFESEAAQEAWSGHPEHLRAKAHGRANFYEEYEVLVCSVIRQREFSAGRSR